MTLPPNHRLNAGELQALLDLLVSAAWDCKDYELVRLYLRAREKLTIQRRLIG